MKHLYKYVAIFVFILFDGLYSFSLCRQYAPNYFAELAMVVKIELMLSIALVIS